jgi:general secretion pathway protein J
MAETATRQTRASGFTLLELLVVITILGLILAALGNGVHFAGQAWQLQERRSARQGDLDAVQNLVRNLIASGASFEGDATSLRFVSELPEALARGGLYEVELHTTEDRLLLSWRPHFKGAQSATATTHTEIIKNVTAFEFTYSIQAGGWQHVLTAAMKRPALIRIGLRIGDRAWPLLVVAPMIDTLEQKRSPDGNSK